MNCEGAVARLPGDSEAASRSKSTSKSRITRKSTGRGTPLFIGDTVTNGLGGVEGANPKPSEGRDFTLTLTREVRAGKKTSHG